MRTDTAERVLTAARLMLIRHGEQHPVDPLALEWARFIVAANEAKPKQRKPYKRRDIAERALANRNALELAWMP
jgi:hypothetical protein